LIEATFTVIVVIFSFCCSRNSSRSTLFSTIEGWFARLADKRALSVTVIGLTTCVLRLLSLPLVPIPQPFIQDEFSFLLAAHTFASGRLTNPTHPMWAHFESFHITFKPTYMSMYFPAQGMVLAAGKVLAGHPWWGVWASAGLMCAAICWMLQGWLPPRWALLGGMLAVLRLGLFSYWMNTYTGGAVAAIGGALVVGALPRIMKTLRARYFFWMAVGIAILVNSRPYEGLLVCIPSVVGLCWVIKKTRPSAASLMRRMAPAAAVLLLTVALAAYYNHRVFGNALTPPYASNRATYASAPHFLWQSQRPEPAYRHKVMRDFYSGWELKWFLESRSPIGFLDHSAIKLTWAALFFLGFALVTPLIMLPRVVRDRRTRFLVVIGFVYAAGLAIETWFIPHYAAPFTAVFFAILMQCMRHLRVWRPGGRPSGLFLVRAITLLCVALALLRLYAQPLNIALAHDTWSTQGWYGTRPLGMKRAYVLTQLERYPGRQLVLVRYASTHEPVDEWVYNAPDIDNSKVVWAREMDPDSDRELFRYFKDRRVWLVEPDSNPPRISPYPVKDDSLLGKDKMASASPARNSPGLKP
jgi:hypothetical protein